jgi:hypothetical protein
MDEHQPHVSFFEFDFIFFDELDLDRMNAVVIGDLPIAVSLLTDPLCVGVDVIKTVIEEFIAMQSIFFQQIVQISLCIVVGGRQIFGKKNIDSKRFRQGGHHFFAGFGQGVKLVSGQIDSEKKGDAHQVDQNDNDKVDN